MLMRLIKWLVGDCGKDNDFCEYMAIIIVTALSISFTITVIGGVFEFFQLMKYKIIADAISNISADDIKELIGLIKGLK